MGQEQATVSPDRQGAVIGKVNNGAFLPPPNSSSNGAIIYGPRPGGDSHASHDDGTLYWNPVNGGNGKYVIRIYSGSSVVVNGYEVTGTSYNVAGLAEGNYTWEVRTQNSEGQAGPWSKTFSFTKRTYLSAPTTLKPNGNMIPTDFPWYNPTLKWDAVSDSVFYTDAVKYKVSICGNYCYDYYTSPNVAQYDTSSLTLDNIRQNWTVTAVDVNNVEGATSSYAAWNQTIMEIDGPASVIYGDTLTVTACLLPAQSNVSVHFKITDVTTHYDVYKLSGVDGSGAGCARYSLVTSTSPGLIEIFAIVDGRNISDDIEYE